MPKEEDYRVYGHYCLMIGSFILLFGLVGIVSGLYRGKIAILFCLGTFLIMIVAIVGSIIGLDFGT